MIIRNSLPAATYLVHLYNDGKVSIPLSPIGFVMTKEEWETFKKAYDLFYSTDEYLKINEERQREIDNAVSESYKEPEKKPPKPGFVYFVKAKETGYIKIGYTTNLKTRLKAMQTASPFELELVDFLEVRNAIDEEMDAHGFFYNRRLRGEWFDISEEEIEAYITERRGTFNG